MQEGFVHEPIQLTGYIRLDDEEKELLSRDRPEGRPDNGIRRIGPDFLTYEVAIPGDSCYDGDGDEDGGLIPVAPGDERVIDHGEYDRKGYREFEMPFARVSGLSHRVHKGIGSVRFTQEHSRNP